MPPLSGQDGPHHRLDGPGSPLGQTEHRRGQYGLWHIQRGRAKAHRLCARSLRELLNDYHDVLRVRSAPAWPKDCREARYVRRLGSNPDVTYEAYRDFCEMRPIEVVANIAICLIHQTNYLLDQQLRQLQRDFVKDGGPRERMFRARRESRDP